MISITTDLLTALLGDVLTAWLSCPAVQCLLSLLVIGFVVRLFVGLVPHK